MLSGPDAGNYIFTAPRDLVADITPLALMVGGLRAFDKIYDGALTAKLSGTAMVSALPDDSVVLSGTAVGLFADKNVGIGKAVSVSGLSLAGTDAGNYSLVAPQDLRANITPLSVAVLGLSASNKVYDGNVSATIAGSARVATLTGDAVTLTGSAAGTFADRNVGSAKPVSISGYSLAGADAGNYRLLVPQGLVASITPATLQYVADRQGRSVGDVFDALTGSVSGFVGGDTRATATQGGLRFTTTATVASPPGAYPIFGSGLGASNYVFVQAAGNATALSLIDLTPLTAAILGALFGDGNAFSLVNEADNAERSNLNVGFVDLQAETAPDGPVVPIGDFRALPLASLSAGELQTILSGRRLFMDNLLADAVEELQRNPSLPDLIECQTLEEARLGVCRVTTKLKSLLPPGTSLTIAALPAPAPGAPPTPAAAPAAPPVAAAPPPVGAAPVTAGTAIAPLSPELSFAKRKVRVASLPEIERKIALVIGVDNYTDPSIPGLNNAVSDARAVAKVFSDKLGYESVVIPNATKPVLVAAMNQLALTLGPRDSVIVYYAGHGELVETTKLG